MTITRASTDGAPEYYDPYFETTDGWGEDVCPWCDGDGGDPLSDYVLPCPECGQ